MEAGIDFSVTDEFSAGPAGGASRRRTSTWTTPGVGSADLDADTWGVYGTWISPNGFYLDASLPLDELRRRPELGGRPDGGRG